MRVLARTTAALLFCAVTWLALRQPVRTATPTSRSMAVWVFFHPDSTRTSLPPALSRYTLHARAARGLPVLENDRPLPPTLIERVRDAGAEIRLESRWLRAVSVNANARTLDRLRALPIVQRLQPVGRVQRAGRSTTSRAVAIANAQVSTACASSLPSDSTLYGDNWQAIRTLGIPAVRSSGFTGSRVRVAILDTGFDPRHEGLASRSIVGARDFIHGDEIVYDQPGDLGTMAARHGTQVFSILGGCSPGIVVGPAYAADFLLAKVDVEPGDSIADEDRWIAGVEWADSLGADVVASPVTFRYDFIDRAPYTYAEMNGDITRTTRIADEAARRGILVVTAIGDAGAGGMGTLSAPADGDSVLAVGAVNAAGEPAVFTSRGPASDGRTKPEVVARGTGLTGASSVSPQSYDRSSLDGTSYSTALIAGAVAMFRQAWPTLTPAAVREAFLLSGDRARAPDNAVGFGVPDVAGAILFPAGLLPDRIEDLDTNGNLTILAPVFSWITRQVHPQLSPVRYTLQIARDSAFNSIVYSDTVREANSLRTRIAIKPATGLRWRVVASTINLQVPVRRISPAGVTFNAPSWVRLISPDPTQVTETNERPEFTWQPLIAPPPIGPLRYDVEILSNQTGNPVQTIRNLTTASVRLQSPLVPNTAYRWRVIVRTQLNQADTVTSTREFIVDSDSAPPSTLLYQNFPNPFPRPDLGQTVTHIWFDLERASEVELSVFDLGGRLIRHLIPAHPSCGRVTLQSGVYGRGPQDPTEQCQRTFWDGTDSAGRQVEAGVYLLRLRANGRDFYRRVLFLPQS